MCGALGGRQGRSQGFAPGLGGPEEQYARNSSNSSDTPTESIRLSSRTA
jgi:hypothetical protein